MFSLRSIRLFAPLIIIVVIIASGVAGFMLIEDYTFLDAAYMTVITITTIGYSEVKPLSEAGRAFNIALIIASFATFAFALTRLTEYIASGEIQKFFKTRQVMQGIHLLKDHVILCGYGRNGQQAAETLRKHKLPFVVIDSSDQIVDSEIQKDRNLLYIKGNATEDEILLAAGIERARALITTLPVDADNVFIVLSARGLNANLTIISRASQTSSQGKLVKAGATHVIMPDKLGGAHMAGLVSRPDLIEFIEYLEREETNSNLGVVDLNNTSTSAKTIGDVISSVQLNVVGLKTTDGEYHINPSLQTTISNGCKVFVLGKEEEIIALQARFK